MGRVVSCGRMATQHGLRYGHCCNNAWHKPSVEQKDRPLCIAAASTSRAGSISANAERISRASSPGLRPNKRLNSRLNCEWLSSPTRTVAPAIAYAIAQPDGVDVSEIIVRPTASPYRSRNPSLPRFFMPQANMPLSVHEPVQYRCWLFRRDHLPKNNPPFLQISTLVLSHQLKIRPHQDVEP